jgi:hypothetical protein
MRKMISRTSAIAATTSATCRLDMRVGRRIAGEGEGGTDDASSGEPFELCTGGWLRTFGGAAADRRMALMRRTSWPSVARWPERESPDVRRLGIQRTTAASRATRT